MKTVIGVFDQQENAQFAVHCLKDARFKLKNMSVVMKDPQQKQTFAENTNVNIGNAAVTGLTTGAVVGGLAGLLIGVGAIAIPGIGAVLIAGPLASAFGLTGAAAATASGAVTGAVAGGLLGTLMGLGLPKEKAKKYEERIQSGAILLAIPTVDEREEEAKEILADHEATDITSVSVPIEVPKVIQSEDQYDEPKYDQATAYHYYQQPHYTPIGVKGGKRVHSSQHMREVHVKEKQDNSEAAKPIQNTQPEIDIL